MYELKSPPEKAALLAIGQRWSPFASIGSWYCWRYLERTRLAATAARQVKKKV